MSNRNDGKANKPLQILLAKWMAAYREIHGGEITLEKLEIYVMLLEDLPLLDLECALVQAAKECTKFPTPADIRKFVARQLEKQDQFESEKAWENVQRIIRTYWWDGKILPKFSSIRPEGWTGRIEEYNGGFLLHPPPFDTATDYAIRLAGGLDRINSAYGDKELDFIRRDFLVNHRRHRETVGLIAPSREEAKAFLDKIQSQKQIPEAK